MDDESTETTAPAPPHMLFNDGVSKNRTPLGATYVVTFHRLVSNRSRVARAGMIISLLNFIQVHLAGRRGRELLLLTEGLR